MSACALAAAMLFAAPPSAEGAKVVVVVQGDAADAGRIQANVESELERQGIRIVRGVGKQIGPPAEAPPPSAQTERAISEIRAAQTAYDSAEFDAAIVKIEAARGILSSTNEPAASDARVAMHLWAAAINIAAGRKEVAEQEVKNLLRIDPDPRVSTDTFPAELAALVEANRPKDVVSVALSNLPEGAVIMVLAPNGTQRFERTQSFAAEKGARIRIRAPHYKPAEIVVPADAPSFPKPVQMALALRDDADKAMRAVLEGTAGKPQIQTLQSVAKAASADALVLVGARGGQSKGAVVWGSRGDAKVSSAGDAASVTSFVQKQLRPASSSAVASEREDGLFTRGGVAVSTWNRNLDGVYQYSLSGAGPALSVDYRKSGILASGELQYVSYALTPIEIDVSGGTEGPSTVKGAGGTALRAAVDAGYEIPAGPVLLGALVGGHFEQYSMTPVKVDVDDVKQPALGSSTYSGASARARVTWSAGPIRVAGSVGALLAPSYAENPKNTSGEKPEASTAPFWRLGASWEQSAKLRLGFDYAGEMRTVAFSGEPKVNRLGDDDLDPTLHEMVNTFSITAAYRF